MTIGAFLRQKREAKGLTIYRLAKFSGISEAQIRFLEQDRVPKPGLIVLCRLSVILDFSMDELKEIVLKEEPT